MGIPGGRSFIRSDSDKPGASTPHHHHPEKQLLSKQRSRGLAQASQLPGAPRAELGFLPGASTLFSISHQEWFQVPRLMIWKSDRSAPFLGSWSLSSGSWHC